MPELGSPHAAGNEVLARPKLTDGSIAPPATLDRSSRPSPRRILAPALITCGDRSKVMLSTNCQVLKLRALYEKFVLISVGRLNMNEYTGSGSGVRKLNPNLLQPTTVSFTNLAVGDHRQFTARFFGVLKVSTKFGAFGKRGRPPFTESP